MIRKGETIHHTRREFSLAYTSGHWRPKRLNRPDKSRGDTRWMGISSGPKLAGYLAWPSRAFDAGASGTTTFLVFAAQRSPGLEWVLHACLPQAQTLKLPLEKG